MVIHLSLLVLRSPAPKELAQFYNDLGFEFVEEQHGTGPIHYAAKMGGIGTLEIYPSKKDPTPVRFGIAVDNIYDFYLRAVERGATEILSPTSSEWGPRCVFRDPHENIVELTEQPQYEMTMDDDVPFTMFGGYPGDSEIKIGSGGKVPPSGGSGVR